jgi:hypothetical protein
MTPKLARQIGMAVPVVFAGVALLMSASSRMHGLFDWVPVSHGNIFVESALKLLMAIVLIAAAVLVVLPVSMAIHVIGHALAGHLFGMRLLAIRVGPVLVTPWAIGNRFELLPIRGKMDVLTAWVQFDDSPLPTWKRQRGWQVMIGGGSAMNLGVSFICAMFSVLAIGVSYVLLRQMVWINLAVCVVNLVPFVWAKYGYESDGKRLMALFLDEGDGADALMERLRDEVVVGPTRPASWPRERVTAWETKLRQMPANDEARPDQLEVMIYLFLQALDRGDRDVAWRWVQAMHHVLAADPGSHDVAFDTGRIMCALHAARWDKNGEAAHTLLEGIDLESDMRFNPWYSVARAATLLAETGASDADVEKKLVEAVAAAELAHGALVEPAKLHGIDQLMQGIALAVKEDGETELQKLAYYANRPAPAKTSAPQPKPVTATEAA